MGFEPPPWASQPCRVSTLEVCSRRNRAVTSFAVGPVMGAGTSERTTTALNCDFVHQVYGDNSRSEALPIDQKPYYVLGR